MFIKSGDKLIKNWVNSRFDIPTYEVKKNVFMVLFL